LFWFCFGGLVGAVLGGDVVKGIVFGSDEGEGVRQRQIQAPCVGDGGRKTGE